MGSIDSSVAAVLACGALSATILATAPVWASPPRWQVGAGSDPHPGEALYLDACAGCHGVDGTGVAQSQVGFATPLPDFSDCDFAAREPDSDWIAVTHGGGPARGFATDMPAFGAALTADELQTVMGYVRTLCGDDSWPRGELNLPRAMFTEKAYPEDEAVFTTAVNITGAGAVMNEIIYEQRFGTRNQWELVVPFGFVETESGDWTHAQLGDVAVGAKRAVYHGLESGTIFSMAAEIIFPTGDPDAGFGKGTTVFEPFASFGQVLPADAFLHVQAGLELPVDRERAVEEGFWRGALGMSFTEGLYGRTWSPMVEVLGARELVSGADVHWDVVPQFQVTLNTRQHIMANVAVRIPLDDASRQAQVLVYLLWDWFDGGLGQGW